MVGRAAVVWASSNPPAVFGVGTDSSFRLFRLSNPLPTFNGGSCKAPISLYCGRVGSPYEAFGAVTTASPSAFGSYPACGPEVTSGGEVYYRLENPVSGTMTITLTPHVANLDLIVTGADTKYRCDTGTCRGDSHAAGLAPETLTLSTIEGQTMYVIVDAGAAGSVSGYTLAVECTKL